MKDDIQQDLEMNLAQGIAQRQKRETKNWIEGRKRQVYTKKSENTHTVKGKGSTHGKGYNNIHKYSGIAHFILF